METTSAPKTSSIRHFLLTYRLHTQSKLTLQRALLDRFDNYVPVVGIAISSRNVGSIIEHYVYLHLGVRIHLTEATFNCLQSTPLVQPFASPDAQVWLMLQDPQRLDYGYLPKLAAIAHHPSFKTYIGRRLLQGESSKDIINEYPFLSYLEKKFDLNQRLYFEDKALAEPSLRRSSFQDFTLLSPDLSKIIKKEPN